MADIINYDIHTEDDLKAHCAGSERIADDYKQACIDYADAKLRLDKLYVDALKAGTIKESAAMEKAIAVISQSSEEAKADYEIFVKTEMVMKGLEKVLDTRGRTVTVHQSLMKNRPKE